MFQNFSSEEDLLTCRLTVKARNTESTAPGQVVYVVMTYLAPAQVDTVLYAENKTANWDLYYRMIKSRFNDAK